MDANLVGLSGVNKFIKKAGIRSLEGSVMREKISLRLEPTCKKMICSLGMFVCRLAKF